jgi:hypothetical protein
MIKNILKYTRKYALVLFLGLPAVSFAQHAFDRQVDSMRKEFFRKDALRRTALPADTGKSQILKSPFLLLYQSPKAATGNSQQLQVQGIRFSRSHFLNFLLRANGTKPFSLNGNSKLYLILADKSSIPLSFAGKADPRGNGMRNSSDLPFEFSLPEAVYQLLTVKEVVVLKLDYEGGSLFYDLGNRGGQALKKACLLINWH